MQEVQEVVRKKMRTRRAIILLGVSMALLFLASALLPTEPSAQTTSPEGKIVYVKLGDIWVMDADGTNQTNLTNTPDTNEDQPAWSSDGTRIAFTSDQDEVPPFTDIWVMNSDGSNQTNLTPTDNPGTPTEETDNFHEYQPSWAPSGAQLAFVREIPGEIISEQSDIFVMDANGQTPATKLTQTDENESAPDWSPDGTKIAFAGVRNQGWEIVTMDPNGQNEAILTGDSFDGEDRGPDWSPDSTMVVFQKQCQGVCSDAWEIWGVNRDGSQDTNLTPNELSEEDRLLTDHTGPSWSPDGSEITFTRTRPSVGRPKRHLRDGCAHHPSSSCYWRDHLDDHDGAGRWRDSLRRVRARQASYNRRALQRARLGGDSRRHHPAQGHEHPPGQQGDQSLPHGQRHGDLLGGDERSLGRGSRRRHPQEELGWRRGCRHRHLQPHRQEGDPQPEPQPRAQHPL